MRVEARWLKPSRNTMGKEKLKLSVLALVKKLIEEIV